MVKAFNAAGKVVCELKHPFRDGIIQILSTPEDFLARLAALVPRPRSNQTRNFYRIGGFAPNSPFRQAVVSGSANPARNKLKKTTIQTATGTSRHQSLDDSPLSWPEQLKRVFDNDISVCSLCGGTVQVISAITRSAQPAILTEDMRTNILPPLSIADHILGWSVYLIST